MKILLHGYTGKMGQIVKELIETHPEHQIVAYVAMDGIDDETHYTSFANVSQTPDVLIDFSHHAATKNVIDYCTTNHVPAVICTTGQTEEEKQMIQDASQQIPIFFSANMSLGIAVLCDLVKKAASMFPEADIEVLEVHHNRKIDVPSGTALLLANAIKTVRPKATFNIGRQGGKRTKEEIGISSLRMGNEIGTHEIYIHTETECITLKHQAYTRAVFADGAYSAMEFLVKQKPGLYTMNEMIQEG